jgi:pilus assembly protein CpaE
MSYSSLDGHGTGGGDGPQQHLPPLPRISIQAFCETLEVKDTIQTMASDRRLSKAMVKVQDGGPAACVEAYRSAPTPNVIIIESVSDRASLLGRLDELAQYCDAGTKVLVIGHVNDVLLYRELMRRGVSEYLIAPVGVLDVIGALTQLFQASDSEPLGRTVAVIGAKGGVGASTIAHNIAFSIAHGLAIATVIVDLDLAYGTAGLDFNQDPPQGLLEALQSPDRLDANFLERLLTKCSDSLSILAAPATLDRPYDLAEDSVDNVIDLLRASVPCIVLDLPHTWNAWTRRILVNADEVVIVAAPDLANLRNAKSMVDNVRASRPNDRKPVLVLNQVGMAKRPEIASADFAKALDLEPSAMIAFDAQLFGMAANNGQMLSEVQAKAKAIEQINELAKQVTGRAEHKGQKRSLLEPLLARLKRKA